MSGFVRQFWPYLLVAAIIHVALAAFLVINLDRGVLVLPDDAPAEAIEATVVDEALVEAELERIQEAERAREQEIEEQRLAAERLVEQRRQEEQRLQALQQQREREAQQAEADRVRREREAAERQAQAERERQAEAERQRQAELERQREAERQRQAELERQRQAELARQRQAEEDRRRRAEEAAAERQRAAAGAEWVAAVRNRIESTWIKPDGWPSGTTCSVMVSLIPGGEVVDVRIVKSSGNPVWDRSVETAIYRASPLPTPSDPAVFQRQLPIDFTPRVD